MEPNMEKLIIVGDDLTTDEEVEVEKDAEAIRSCGMEIVRVLNYRGGSIKFVAKIVEGGSQPEMRRKLEDVGWTMGAPYFSKGEVTGFKLSKRQKISDVSAWSD